MTSDERASRPLPPRRQRWGSGLVLGAFIASWAQPAAGQPRALSAKARAVAATSDAAQTNQRRTAPNDFLVWHAPAGCSTAAAIRERVGELLGQTELDLKHVRRVEGRVSETRDGWALVLTMVDGAGARERQIASPHCADLAEAAAVAISLAFEAARARERAEQAAALTPDAENIAPIGEAPAPAPDSAEAAPPAAPEAGPSGAFEPWLGAELWLDAHALPAAAPGVSVRAALRGGDVEVGAFAAWLPGVERGVGPGQSVSFSLWLGGVRACYTLGHGVVDTALCAGFEAGRLSASGNELLSARSTADLWLAPELGLELSSALSSHLALHLRADAIAPLLRQRYAVNETDDVHHVASVGVRAAAGVLIGF